MNNDEYLSLMVKKADYRQALKALNMMLEKHRELQQLLIRSQGLEKSEAVMMANHLDILKEKRYAMSKGISRCSKEMAKLKCQSFFGNSQPEFTF